MGVIIPIPLIISPFIVAGSIVGYIFAGTGHAVEILFRLRCPLLKQNLVGAARVIG